MHPNTSLLINGKATTLVSNNCPLQFVAINLSVLLSKSLNDRLFLLKMIYIYSKLTSAVLAYRTTALNISPLFVNNWTVLYCIPMRLLIDSETQSVRELFDLLCIFFAMNNLTATAYRCKRMDMQSDSVLPLSQGYNTIWQRISDTGHVFTAAAIRV